jgi:hypothetical protein
MRLSAALEAGAAYNRRRHDRHHVNIGAGLSSNVKPTFPIAVVDLSVGGCGIETTLDLACGSRVWLKLPGLESWPARVSWAEDGRAGLSFDNELHPAIVARFVVQP